MAEDRIAAVAFDPARPTVAAACGMAGLLLAGIFAASALALRLPPGLRESGLTLGYSLPFCVAPIALYGRCRPGFGAVARLRPMPRWALLPAILLGAGCVSASIGLVAVWSLLLARAGLSQGANPLDFSGGILAALVNTAVLPAIVEELLFRGFVLSAWESRGSALAVGASAAMFALLHCNLYGWPTYLVLGVAAGSLAVQTGSILPGMIAHGLGNGLVLLLGWSMQRRGVDAVGAAPLLALAAGGLLIVPATLARVRARAAKEGAVLEIPRVRRPLSGRDRAALALYVGATLLLTWLNL